MRIEDTPAYRIAYFRRIGPYGPANAAQIESLKEWAARSGLLTDDVILLGIANDDPALTSPTECRYDAAIVIADDFDLTGSGLMERRAPGGRAAILEVPHTAEGVSRAWATAMPTIAQAGQRRDTARPISERYVPRLLQRHRCELVIPIL